MANYYSPSPPPLQHPVPTHPAFIPEPPSTPASPQGYQRYTSSPPVHQLPPLQQQQQQAAYGSPPQGYTNPFQHQQHAQHNTASPHVGGGFNAPAADFAAWGLDAATAQFGMQLGQNAVNAGQAYVQKNVSPSSHYKALFFFFFVAILRLMEFGSWVDSCPSMQLSNTLMYPIHT
jgi:protein transport protein YIF1